MLLGEGLPQSNVNKVAGFGNFNEDANADVLTFFMPKDEVVNGESWRRINLL